MYGYSMKAMYDKSFLSVQTNGYVAEPLPIQCSVRPDCLMSMLIFALVLPAYKSVGATSYGHQKLDIKPRKPRRWHTPKMPGFL